MKNAKRALALLLCLMMVITAVPMGAVADSVKAFAAELTTASTADATLQASLNEAKAYIDGITINSKSNVPATVVKNFGTHFTWDNEKREGKKGYLFDWSYYNGVVFEGIEYVYEVTGDELYKDYVIEYMSSLIASNGTWATCTNNSSKECAGYNSTHGADCYKTASLLLDAYEMTNDNRYLTMAATLYADLDTAAKSYSLANAGNNFRHTWSSDPSPDLWLDGLYMILPFRAEYAKHIGDTAELDLIVKRLQWVSDNMYNSSKKLFYHAADSATSNSGSYWLRAMGWYAAAMVDVMDSMEGTNLETMKAQLKKFVEGMKACQNASNGMWLNNMDAEESDSNPYETSGTALVCYAVMKAVNNGWLDKSYADMAILAFNGICKNKLDGDTLKDICYIGNPGSSNSKFKANEGKGVGPFIMFYAEMLEYVNNDDNSGSEGGSTETPGDSDDATTETPSSENIEINNTTITVDGATNVTGSATVEAEEENLVNEFAAEKNYTEVLLYNISATLPEGAKATLTFPIPEGWDTNRIVGISVEENEVIEIPNSECTITDGKISFTVDHFSAKGIALTADDVTINNWVTITAPTDGTTTYTYTLDNDGVNVGEKYLIVSDNYALNNSGTRTQISKSGQTISVTDDSALAWVFSNSSKGTIKNVIGNSSKYISLSNNTTVVSNSGSTLTISDQGNGNYRVYNDSSKLYLRYRSSSWQSYKYAGNVLLYVLTSEPTEGTDGLYGATHSISGATSYTFNYDVKQEDILAALKEDIDIYYTTDKSATKGTPYGDDDEGMEWILTAVDGGYKLSITYNDVEIGKADVKLKIPEIAGSDVGVGNLIGGITYTLDTNGIDTGDDDKYLIVSAKDNGTAYVLNNEGGRTQVTITDNKITVTDDAAVSWVFSDDEYGTVKNEAGNTYIRLANGNVLGTGRNLSFENIGSGAYQIIYYSYYYLRYNNGWSRSSTESDVYLFKYDGASAGSQVMFTLTPDAATIKPLETKALTGKVTVNGTEVDLSKCTITWASSDTKIATVSNGTVTGVANGTANITATLTAVNGVALQEAITLTSKITVKTATLTKTELVPVPYEGTVYVNSGSAVKTGAKIVYTYSDGTTTSVDVTVGMLTDSANKAVSTTTVGKIENLTVTYGNNKFNNFTLNVIAKPNMDYPEYPNEGSVQVDKFIADYSQFQNTGVAEINLTTSGLPAITGVDVILVTDLSNSMAREAGATSDGDYEVTKLDDLKVAVGNFADTFLGDDTVNTISLVTFGGYDEEYKGTYNNTNTNETQVYADSTRTMAVGLTSAENVKSTINQISLKRDTTYAGEFKLSFDGGQTWNGNYGNTNYDHAFMETYQAISTLKTQYKSDYGIEYDESGRSIYVLFMTDGAPSNYNGMYYRTSSQGTSGPQATTTWVNQEGEAEVYGRMSANNVNSWYTYIAGSAYDRANESIKGNALYWANQVFSLGVKDIYPIGFDLDNGGFNSMKFTEEEGYPLVKVLEKLAEGKTLTVYEADDSNALNQIYAKLASDIKFAATKAYFVDQMGDDFKLQLASSVYKEQLGSPVNLTPVPQITISTKNIYTQADVDSGKISANMIGQEYGAEHIEEVVTFKADGSEAYSDLSYKKYVTNLDGTLTETNFNAGDNILVNNVIYGNYFWYNTSSTTIRIDTNGDGTADHDLPGETFYWNIGTINNQKFIMSYYVYLEGAAEGTRPAGTYDTNNYAILNYENWLGNKANQSVESPSLSWYSASVYYGFYLVDKYGNPVTDRATGATGSFADAVKVTSKIYHDEVLLNSNEKLASIEVASTQVPEGYTVYDNGAIYTLRVDSNKNEEDIYVNTLSGWEIKIGKDEDGNTLPTTTYVTDYHGNDYSKVLNTDTVDKTGWDFTSTTVWFAVYWEPQCVNDVVVIDYGLPVDIGVLENDMFGTAGKLVGLGAASPLTGTAKFGSSAAFVDDNKAVTTITETYGTATINGSEVRYTPSSMVMDSFDKFTYEVSYMNVNNSNKLEYYYGDVTVIPATTIYYEDTFVTLKTYTKVDGVYTPDDKWDVESDNTSATQGEDRPGYYSLSAIDQNKIYGYDAAYNNMSTHSMNNSAMITVTPNKYGTAEFTFYGTGFDVISVTSKDTGVITVQVKDAENNLVVSKMVDTYYGMTKNGDNWETTNRDALYQIPVIKVADLAYGRYSVTIRASYYDALNNNRVEGEDGKVTGDGSYDIYLDAIRIYNPAGDGVKENADGTTDTTIQDAYKADNEAWPRYQEVRNNVIEAATLNESGATVINGVAFIDGIGDTANVSDYISYGPNNELYLKPGQAIAFNLTLPANNDKVHLAIKSADGNNVTYKIFDGASIKAEKDLEDFKANTLTTTTDLYYDITSLKEKTIVIYNSGSSGIISLTNIKMTFTADPGEIGSVFYVSGDIIKNIADNMNKEPEFIPNKAITVSTSPKTIYVGNKITVTVTTGTDVEAVSVDGTTITKYYKRGSTRVWTTSIDAEAAGTQNISVVAYNSEGIASAPVTATATVNAYASWATTTIGKIINTVLDWLFK